MVAELFEILYPNDKAGRAAALNPIPGLPGSWRCILIWPLAKRHEVDAIASLQLSHVYNEDHSWRAYFTISAATAYTAHAALLETVKEYTVLTQPLFWFNCRDTQLAFERGGDNVLLIQRFPVPLSDEEVSAYSDKIRELPACKAAVNNGQGVAVITHQLVTLTFMQEVANLY